MPSADVLHVCFGGLGGHQSVVTSLSRELRQVGVTSAAVAIAPESLLDRADSHWTGLEHVDFVPLRHRADVASMLDSARDTWAAGARILVVHTHRHGSAAALGQIARSRALRVVTVDHTSPNDRNRGATAGLLAAAACSRALVHLTEESLRSSPLRRLPLPAWRNSVVIPNGVELARFAAPRTDVRGELSVIGMASRLVPQKDSETLLRAARLLIDGAHPTLRVSIAGDGPRRERLEALATELGIADRVDFRGNVPEVEMPEFLRELDVYVQATLGETLSMSLLEASASGLPIVASRVPGVSNVFTHNENALLVPPRDSTAMAAAISNLLDSRELSARLSARALELARTRYSATRMAEGYATLFAGIDTNGPWNGALERLRAQPMTEDSKL